MNKNTIFQKTDSYLFLFQDFIFILNSVFICEYRFVHMSAVSAELREIVRSPGGGVIGVWAAWCGIEELNPDPMEDQEVLLTAEPSL